MIEHISLNFLIIIKLISRQLNRYSPASYHKSIIFFKCAGNIAYLLLISKLRQVSFDKASAYLLGSFGPTSWEMDMRCPFLLWELSKFIDLAPEELRLNNMTNADNEHQKTNYIPGQ